MPSDPDDFYPPLDEDGFTYENASGFFHRLDERTERMDNRLERIDDRLQEQDAVLRNHDDRIQRTESILQVITFGVGSVLASVFAKVGGLIRF